jgi:hypothetical protein
MMTLNKILNNKDVIAGKVGFCPATDDSTYYMIATTTAGSIVQAHTPAGILFGITPFPDILAGEWVLYPIKKTKKQDKDIQSETPL